MEPFPDPDYTWPHDQRNESKEHARNAQAGEVSWAWPLFAAGSTWISWRWTWGSSLSHSRAKRLLLNTLPIIWVYPTVGRPKSTWSEFISCLHSSYCPGFHTPLQASGYPGEESKVRSLCHAIFLLLNSLISIKVAATGIYLACDLSGMNGRSSVRKHPQKSQATHFLHIIASGHTVM